MSRDDDRAGPRATATSRGRRRRSARVLDAYLAGLEAGRPADPERLLADHPEIADRLRDCLEVMNLADGSPTLGLPARLGPRGCAVTAVPDGPRDA